MSESLEDYQQKLEHHQLAKNEGMKAYAEALASVFPDLPEEKVILISEGLKALLSGPPPMPMPPLPTATIVGYADFVSPVFEEKGHGGLVRLWDWPALRSRCTHFEWCDEELSCFDGLTELMALAGDPAKAFWKWLQAVNQPMKGR